MEKEIKHTPGPWKADQFGEIEDARGNIIAVTVQGKQWQMEGGKIDVEEFPYEANARLMAASTEMYELMPKLISLLGNWAYILDQVGGYDTSESWDLADKWIDIRMKIEGDES